PAGLSDTTTVTVQAPQVTKTLVGTSIVDAFNTNTQGVIGEIATFELSVDVPRGTTPSAVVVDSLPAGLAFVRMVGSPVVDPGVTFTGSATPVVTNSGRTVTFNLGDVVNANADGERHGITVRYEAVVLNVSSNVAGKTLTNDAKLTWTGHDELPAAKSAPLTVIEPKLTIDKSVTPTTAQASDTVTFTIVVAASQTTAHNVALSDIFPGGITYVAGSLKHTAGVVPTTLATAAGGDAFTATFTQLTPGQTSTIEFRAKLDPSVTAGQAITNVVTETWTSLPGNPGLITPNNPNAYERTGAESTSQGQLNNYKTSDSAIVTVAQPTVTKALVTTSIVNASNSATQAVIGETATYTVTMKLPQGRTPAAQLIDLMGPGMAFVRVISAVNDDPGRLVVPGLNTAPALTNDGTTATWTLGDIVNTDTDSGTDETITFTIETVVLNVSGNVSGVFITNRAQARWGGANTSALAHSGAVQVIEPKLRTTKAAAVGGFGGTAGDPVTYTIVVRQSLSSDTDAFGVTLRDVIPAKITNPVLVSVVDSAGPVTAANFSLSGNTLTTTGAGFDLPKLPTDRTITITVTGTLAGPLAANEKITNTNQIKWSSLPGTPGQITPNSPQAYERTGSESTSQGQLNNYVTTGSATITANTADLAVVKTVSNTTPNVGDTITFTVTLTNNGPNAAHLVEVTDQFPTTGLQLLSVTPSQGTFNESTGLWTVGTVGVGAANKQTLTIQAKVLAPAVNTIPAAQTNVATVTKSAEPDSNPGNNTGTATETPQYADLAVTKQTDQPEPNVGATVTYTITLRNNGTATATGVEVTDTLPGDVTYVAAVAAGGTTFTPSGTPVAGGVWRVPAIAPGQSLVLTMSVTADATGVQFNTATISKSDVWDPDNGNNTAKTPIDAQAADLVVAKTVDDATPNVGALVTFTVTLDNLGPSTARDVEVDDLLPAGLAYQSHTASTGDYDEGTGVWTVGDVASGATNTLTIVALVTAPSSGPAPARTNTAAATSQTIDPNPGNNTDSSTVTPKQADLAVEKVVSDNTPKVGDTITYTITVSNRGPDTATNVVVNDNLPAGLIFVSATPSQGSYDAGTGVWAVGTVTTSDFPALVVVATVDRPASGIPQPATNTATVSGTEYDPDTSNNTDSVTETPQYADLAVDKVVSDARPNVGDVITYTVTLSNKGQDTATGVTILDQLPAGLEFVAATASEGTYDSGSGIWTVGTVDTLFARTLSIQARVRPPVSGSPQPQTNTASVQTSDQYDPDPANNTDSVTETPRYADLAVTKRVDDPAPNVGGQVTFTVEITNLGADEATGVAVRDLLPTGLTFVSAGASAGTSYDPATGIW
ncbi:MAG: isopeptide-forming domain-containing fimbrial protein, partial [Planctomycetia bacterium]